MSDEIEEIRRRWEAATPGPWCDEADDSLDPLGERRRVIEWRRRVAPRRTTARVPYLATVYSREDATAIAAAPSDVGTLLAEIDRLAGERAIAEGNLDSMTPVMNRVAAERDAAIARAESAERERDEARSRPPAFNTCEDCERFERRMVALKSRIADLMSDRREARAELAALRKVRDAAERVVSEIFYGDWDAMKTVGEQLRAALAAARGEVGGHE